MKIDAIKWHMINGGLKSTNFLVRPSTGYNEGGLGSETIVETFTVKASDGSEFLVSITRLQKETD